MEKWLMQTHLLTHSHSPNLEMISHLKKAGYSEISKFLGYSLLIYENSDFKVFFGNLEGVRCGHIKNALTIRVKE